MTRYAIYWTPARDHPLWGAGCAWLGRDAERSTPAMPTREHTAEPRRYGFHATLKAPMRLADDRDEAALLAAVRAIADTSPPFAMPDLEVRMLTDFVALQARAPLAAAHPLQRLADRCVIALDGFRDASIARDIARRSVGVSERQGALLDAYGYPFLLEQWRFHMTLSDALPRDAAGRAAQDALLREAADWFAAALVTPLEATEIAVFIEHEADAPFVLAHRIALRG
jgi:hypothetical protein